MSLDEFNASRSAAVNQVRQVKTTPEIRGATRRYWCTSTCCCCEVIRRASLIVVIYQELLVRKTRSTPPAKLPSQGHHLELLRWYVLALLQECASNTPGLLYVYYPCTDGLHCYTRCSVHVSSTLTAKMGDSNITDKCMNAMRGFAVMKGQFTPTEGMENMGGQDRTRAGAR